MPRIDGRPGSSLAPLDLDKLRDELEKKYNGPVRCVDLCSAALYPKVYEEYRQARARWGDLSVLQTRHFLAKPVVGEEINVEIEQGKVLIIKLQAVGQIYEKSGLREVFSS